MDTLADYQAAFYWEAAQPGAYCVVDGWAEPEPGCGCAGWYCVQDRAPPGPPPPEAAGLAERMNGDVRPGPPAPPGAPVRHLHSDRHGWARLLHEHVGGHLEHEHPAYAP